MSPIVTKISRRFEGVVVSDKMSKTRTVLVESVKAHPKYGKRFKVSHKYLAHDESNASKAGDRVTIEASRPFSRLKRWRIVKKVN